MMPLTEEWLEKAASDYRTMRRESRVIEEPSYDSICFHAQQCVEKLLKAFLHSESIPFPKTHDIRDLLLLTLPIRPEWEKLIESNAFLTKYASNSRYPGESVFKEDADEAVVACERVRQIILQAFKGSDQLRLE
jgi:HEPN domain-containing protein